MPESSEPPPRRTHVCPWWLAYTFDNPLRRLFDPPQKALGPYLSPGMTVLDVGCGFGHFSIGAARLVGPSGHVTAADLQPEMLAKTMARAKKLGLDAVIEPWRCEPDRIGWTGQADFAVAGNVLHETPDLAAFLSELLTLLKPGGILYVTEPGLHVNRRAFAREQETAERAGFKVEKLPGVLPARRALFRKPE